MRNNYLTTGQVAKELKVSVTTLKRWLSEDSLVESTARNAIGWRLFTPEDVEKIKMFKEDKKKNGKQYSAAVLMPVF